MVINASEELSYGLMHGILHELKLNQLVIQTPGCEGPGGSLSGEKGTHFCKRLLDLGLLCCLLRGISRY
jgi:hypothetical protein